MATIPNRQDAVKSSAAESDRSPAGDAFIVLVDQVVRLIRLLRPEGEALAGSAKQTLARWIVLETVEAEPATVAQIARSLASTRQSVQRVADLLARDRLASYAENPRHRRAKLLRLTDEGRQAITMMKKTQRVWAEALGAEIGEADLRRASVVLDKVRQALTARRMRGGPVQ